MNKNLDAIIIDDDLLVHAMWELAAIKNDKNIRLYQYPQDFWADSNIISQDTTIYIDSNLSNGMKGEIIAQEVYAQGFTNIYLITGEQKYNFAKQYWLRDILDKTPPWG